MCPDASCIDCQAFGTANTCLKLYLPRSALSNGCIFGELTVARLASTQRFRRKHWQSEMARLAQQLISLPQFVSVKLDQQFSESSSMVVNDAESNRSDVRWFNHLVTSLPF